MFKILFILGFLSVVDLVVQKELSLVILKKINDIEEPASSVLIIENANNISLTCQTVDMKKKNYIDNPVVWSKQTNRYNVGFSSERKNGHKNKIFNMIQPSTLSFIPVKIHDGGTYFCINLKYNLSKQLQLIVQPRKLEKKTHGENRWKRDQYNYGFGYPGATREPQVPRIDLSDPVGDFLNGRRKSNNPQVGSGTNIYGRGHIDLSDTLYNNPNVHYPYPSWEDNSNKYPSNWYENDPAGNDNVIHISSEPSDTTESGKIKISSSIFYLLAAFGTLALIGVLMCFVCRRKNSTLREVPVNAIPLPYESLNLPASRIVERINSSIPTAPPAPGARFENDDGTTFLTSLITPENINANRGYTQPAHLDVPPSYDNTVRNPGYGSRDNPSAPMISGCDLPPSYDEALAKLTHVNLPSAPPHYSSTTQPFDVTRAALQTVRDAPLVSRNDV